MLLREKFGIVGTSLGLVKAGYREVALSFEQWQTEIGKKYHFAAKTCEITANLDAIVHALHPLSTPSTKSLLIEVNECWTLYLDNGTRGTDSVGAMRVLSEQMGVRSLRVTSAPHTMSRSVEQMSVGSYGANILEVFDDLGDTERSICCANDGGKWVFSQYGTPYEFEDIESYTARRTASRFSEDILRKYLSRLAIDVLDTETFGERSLGAILVEKRMTRITGSRNTITNNGSLTNNVE